MRSMKNTAVRLVIFLIVFAMMLSIVSCGSKKDEHEHSYSTEVVAPTCTEKGYTKHTCSCGDSYIDNETPAGHKMVEVVEKAPTCTEAGESACRACSVCGYVDGQKTVIPATGHLYDTTYEYPTATEAGSKNSVCRTCGDTQTQVIEALGVTLPEASKLLANIIGSFAVTLEATKGTEFVYVTEFNYSEAESKGSKKAVFVEVAEAAIDSTGEVLKARLQIKVGVAETELTGLVPSKEIAVDKTDAEYTEISFFVNGDDIAISVNGQNGEANMSEMLYSYLAEMMGMGSYEDLQAILANGRLIEDLTNLSAVLGEKLLGAAAGELGSIDSAYLEHLAELFEVLGAEIMTATLDKNGNTTYSLNLAALKTLLAEIDGKTVAEYLESVYGKNVVASMTSFLKSLPEKTIKDVVNAAVNLADGTGIAIGDIYTLIDLYVYTATGIEFSIESQIADRYNSTLVDLLAELNGIDATDKAEFVAYVKSTFAQIAEVISTVSFEDIFTAFIKPTEGDIFEDLKFMIDMIDEQIVYNFTVDAEGNLVAMNYAFAGIEYSVVVNGNETVISASLPNGMSMTERIIIDGSTYTYEVDLRDAQNDLLDYKVVATDGVVTEFVAALRGYETTYKVVEMYDPYFDEWFYYEEPVTTFVTYLTVDYKDADGQKVLNVSAAETEIIATVVDGNLTFAITEDGEAIANGAYTTSTETVNEDVFEYVSAFLSDGRNDLLVYNATSVNGTVTEAYAAVKGYILHTEHNHETTEPEYGYDTKPMPEGGFVTGTISEDGFGQGVVIGPAYDCSNCVTTEEYVTWLEVTYIVNDDGTKVLEFNAHDDMNDSTEGIDQLTVTIDGDTVTGILAKDGDLIALIELISTETGLTAEVVDLQDGANTTMALLVIELNEELTAIKMVSLVVNDYDYEYPEEGEPIQELVEIFNGSFEWIDNAEGADYIVVTIYGMEFVLGYEVTENSINISLIEKKDEAVNLEFAVTENGDAITFDVLFGTWGRTVLDGAVTVSFTEDTVAIAIDLDHLVTFDNSTYTDYIEFEGALQFKLN